MMIQPFVGAARSALALGVVLFAVMLPAWSSWLVRPSWGAEWTAIGDGPPEYSFMVLVPQGWKSEAVTWRRSAVEVGRAAVTSSPDGTIVLFIGDGGSRVFSEPNSMTQFGGLKVGDPYMPDANLQTIIWPYQTGAEWARTYAGIRLNKICANPQVSEIRDLPLQSGMLDYAFQQPDRARVSMSAGEASFTCTMAGQPGAGYIFSATQRVSIGENALWSVEPLIGFGSTAARAGEALELLIRFATSVQINPEWVGRQGLTTMGVSNIIVGTNTAVSKSISDSFWYRRAMQDRTFAQGSQARRGVRTYRDPALGENYELDNRGYKWIDASGRIIATPTDNAPGTGFRLLELVQ